MTQDETREIETLLDLFEHDGWKLFIKEKEGILESLKQNATNNCPTNDTWQFNRGMVALLEGLISYETSIRFVMTQEEIEEDFSQE